jgi:hypothetical protein
MKVVDTTKLIVCWRRFCQTGDLACVERKLMTSALIAIGIYLVFIAFFMFLANTAVGFYVWNPLLIVGFSLLVAHYCRSMCLIQRYPQVSIIAPVVLGMVASIVALISPNFHSVDVYSYISPGWQQLHYHVNPYVTLIRQTQGYGFDPMLTRVWAENPLPYGFAFAHFTKWICWLGQGSPTATYALFKAFNWLIYCGTSAILYFGAKKLSLENPKLSLYLFAWSPLVLMQVLCNGHNDILMSFFVLFGLFFAGINSFALAAVAIVTGGLVKYVWLFSLPFLLILAARKRGINAVLKASAAALVTAAVWSYPYISDWHQFKWNAIASNISQDRSSLFAVMHYLGIAVNAAFFHGAAWFATACQTAIASCKIALTSAFAVFASILLYRSAVDRKFLTFNRLLEMSVFAITIWICVVNAKFYCWYLVMVLPAAFWLPEQSYTRRLVLMLSCTHLLGLTSFGQGHILDWTLQTMLPIAWFALYWRKQRLVAEKTSGLNLFRTCVNVNCHLML